MSLKAQVQLRVPFHDVDILHIAWHGHYAKYFEIARTALMQACALDWPALKEQSIAMPVVDFQVQYRKPLLYDVEVVVEAEIREIEYPELKVHYRILGKEDGLLRASGHTRQIYFSMSEQRSLYDVPEWVSKRLALAKGPIL